MLVSRLETVAVPAIFVTLLVNQLTSEPVKTPQEPVEAGCICPAIYEPICGSNGKNYSNSCVLNCDRKKDPYLQGLCEGECPCCKKPYYNEPLVMENGWGWGGWGWKIDESLWNPGTQLAADSKKEISYPCNCTYDYKPVCGSDDTTYPNTCALECEQKYKNRCLTQVCEGECPCKCN